MEYAKNQPAASRLSAQRSKEELHKTAAVSLKDSLYGRLLGLTALKNGGFVGDYGYGANMSIRGNQTTTENNLLI